MREILTKFPGMIDMLLQRALETKTNKERPEARASRERLISRLKRINGEMAVYAEKEGPSMSEEQRQALQQLQNNPEGLKKLAAKFSKTVEEPQSDDPKQLSFDFLDDSK